ncbi:MAG: transcription initiation factor IIB family protein [Halodesulfurarchaeum sp.]|nr:transcription initiation factor IIB family protein [Halodesulfurarchaeum sp.]
MYRAGTERAEQSTLAALDRVSERLDLDTTARSAARELFLSQLPVEERSKDALLATSIYAGALIAGDQRSQTAVADAADVSRLTIQSRWRPLLEKAGFETPSW